MKLSRILTHYSPKTLLCASVLLLLCLVHRPASASDIYQVDNVVADSDGKDTTDARTKALAKGEKDAFSQLILRLNPANAAQIFSQVSPSQVSASVRKFTVLNEKMSGDHYHATLNYSFDPNQIQQWAPPSAPPSTPPPATSLESMSPAPPPTAGASAPAAPTRIRKAVLVLPVYSDNGHKELWQDDNMWRNVWYEAALESGGGLVVVPLGDISDRIDVDDTNEDMATSDSLKHMYERYGVGEIMVLEAVFNQKADPKPALEVTMKKITAGKPEITQASYTIHSTETPDALMARASSDIARQIYKQQTIDPGKIEYDRLKEINARINTSSIQEWQALRQRLLMRSNIVDIRFVSISYYETRMVISFKGTPDMLGKTLVASGLRVLQDGDSLVLSVK